MAESDAGFKLAPAQIWDAATGLPVTPMFRRGYGTNEADYRTVKFPPLRSS